MLDHAQRTRAIQAFAARQWRAVVDLLAADGPDTRDVDVARMYALSLCELGQREEALRLLKLLAARRPDAAVVHVNLASVLRRVGAAAEAENALRRAVALEPRLFGAAYNLGLLLKAEARLADALPWLRQASVLAPGHDQVRVILGEVLKALGDVSAAVAQFRAAIALRPQCGAAWWGIANLKTGALTAEDCARLDALWAGSLSARDRETLGFARASAHATHSEPAVAWQALLDANAVVAAARPFDVTSFREELTRVTRNLAAAPAEIAATEAVFIVGLPRSGSTLLEQMLAAHPTLAAAGELPDLPALVDERRRAGGPDWRATMTPDAWAELGAAYRARTQRWRRDRPVVIDKLPDNVMRIDVILRMLPGARVIDCRRDARDCALSCLQQYFAYGSAFSFDQDAFAAYYRGYRELMAMALAADPARVHRIDYEHLVAEPQACIAEVLRFLGLPFDAACLSPQRVQREVRTASAAQVIDPVDQRGIGRWRRFERAFAGWTRDGRESVSLT